MRRVVLEKRSTMAMTAEAFGLPSFGCRESLEFQLRFDWGDDVWLVGRKGNRLACVRFQIGGWLD